MQVGVAVDLGSVDPVRGQLDAASRLIEVAEVNGISSVWLGESYHRQPEVFHLPAALLTLAHLAARTELPLGTAVLLARAYHPERLAHEAALVDQLCRGRLSVGIGLGGPDLPARFSTESPDRPVGQWFDDFIAALRAAWSAEKVAPVPVQPEGPSLLIGGRTAAAARRAARVGDGYYAATNYGDSLLAERASTYWSHRGDAPGTVAVTRMCLIAPEARQAADLAAAHFAAVLGYYTDRGAWHDTSDSAGPPMGLVGSPADVVRTLRRYAAAGVTSVQLRIAPVGMPPEVSRRTLELFGSAVRPEIQDL